MAGVRIGIQLPEEYERKARLVAKYKGIPRASWIALMAQRMIELSYWEYLSIWKQDAEEQGVSLEEFLARLDSSSEDD